MRTEAARLRGFTLIELLVVIAIIAILAAILFPVFAQAREKARGITCVSNQKQILLAIMQYSQDYDEMYPRGNDSGSANCSGPCETGWDGNINTDDQAFGIENALEPYMKVAGSFWGPERRNGVWTCPSDAVQRDDCDGAPGIGTGFDISYAFTNYNPNVPGEWGVFSFTHEQPSLALAGLGAPGDTVIMWEWWNPQGYSRYQALTRYDMGALVGNFAVYPDPTVVLTNLCGDGYDWHFWFGGHNHITNFGWADGHVKAMPKSALYNVNPNTLEWNGLKPNLMHYDAQYH